MTGGGAGIGPVPGYAAALCAGLSVWLLARRDRQLRRAYLILAGAEAAGAGSGGLPGTGEVAARLRHWWRMRFGGRIGHEVWCLPAGCVLALLGESVLPLLLGLVAVPLARRWLRGRAHRRVRDRTVGQVIEMCATVAGELRAGGQPHEALLAAVTGSLGSAEAPVTAAARFGGDVPEALRQAACRPGAEGLRGVAACWQVAADGGAGLAAALERVAAALRAEREQAEELHAQLAGTRSTAGMLALLPVFGLLMGSALGAEPLRVLLHTPAGWACLVVGGLLEWAGLTWTARIVRAAVAGSGSGAA